MELAETARPSEYRTIQGGGSSRTAAALVALLKLAPIGLLQIFCGLTLYMMYAFLALLPVGAPILGLASLVFPGAPEKSVRLIGNVMAGGIVAALCLLVHTVIVLHLSNGGLGAWSTILFIWVATYILWKLMQPLVSLTAILSSALGGGRVIRPNIGRTLLLAALLRGRGGRPGPSDAGDGGGWSPVPRPGPGGGGGGGGGGPRPRPENRPGGGGWLVPRPAGGLGGGGGGGGPGGGPRYWRIDVERPGGTADVAPSGTALGAAPTGDELALPAGEPSRNLPARRGGEASFLRGADTGAPHGQSPSESSAMYHTGTGADTFARPDLRAADRVDTTDSGVPVYRITGLYEPPRHRRPPRTSRSSAPPPASPPPRPELRRTDW